MRSSEVLVRLAAKGKQLPLAEALFQVQPNAVIETVRKGQTIVREDDFADYSLLLLEGWLAFSKMLPEGETQIIDVMLPGDFALVGATNAPKAACTVEALSAARIINIRPGDANGPGADAAALRELLAAEIVRYQSRTSELLLRMGKGSASSRIAYALLELFVRLEAVGLTRETTFVLPMTQHKIGEFTGLSNVHVNRTMRRMERENTISYPNRGEITLTDLQALSDAAGIDLAAFRDEILVCNGISPKP